MSLIALIVILIVLGVILYFVQRSPINNTIKYIIYAVIIFTACYLVLDATGVLGEVRGVKVPHVLYESDYAV